MRDGTMPDALVRIFLTLCLLAFALIVGVPLHRRRWKPITITKARSLKNRAMELGLLVGLVGWLAWLLHVIVRGTNDLLVQQLGGMLELGSFYLVAALLGAALLIAGLLLVAFGISEMDDQWRIGIDEQDPQTRVVQTGIFKVLRHPIYTGICCIAGGAVLVLPHFVTAALAVGSIAGAVAQMKLEETVMRERFGDAYK